MKDAQAERDARISGLLEQALVEVRVRGELDAASWRARHPEDADEVLGLVATLAAIDSAVASCRQSAVETAGDGPAAAETGGDPLLGEPPPPKQVGRYRILARLGRGGMGTVYRAHDPQLGRDVAVKVPRFEGPREAREQAQKRFLREARAAAAVRHPNVCPIYDVGEHEGVPYVVMALVEGESLAGPLGKGRYDDCRAAARLIAQVAEALEAIHAHGIVHRDLKPANILLDKSGQPVLTDFGLARAQDAEHLTADGSLLGTPAYMAPEQASLEVGPVGPATDVYGLAVVLYQMLTGRTPFQGEALTVIYQVAQQPPPPPTQFRPDLDSALAGILAKAMARRPEDRYATARAFGQALRAWATRTTRLKEAPKAAAPAAKTQLRPAAAPRPRTQAAPPPRPGPAAPPAPPARRRLPLGIVAAAAFGSLVLAAGVVLLIQTDRGELTVKVSDPDAKVVVEGKTVTIDAQGVGHVVLTTGEHTVEATYPDGKVDARKATVTRGGGEIAFDYKPAGTDLKFPPIPAAERFDWQPKELVAVFGTHGWRHWSTGVWNSAPPGLFFREDGKGLTAMAAHRYSDAPVDDVLRFWDAATGRGLGVVRLPGLRQTVYAPDGSAVATLQGTAEDWTVVVWDAATQKELLRVKDSTAPGTLIHSLAGGGKLLALGGSNTVRLWDVAAGKELPPLPRFPAPIGPVMFSADGKWVAVVLPGEGQEKKATLRVWNVVTREERPALTGLPDHTGWTFWALSPDGRTVARGGLDDAAIRLWDLETGQEGAPLKGSNEGCVVLTWEPDGKTLASASRSDNVRLWDAAAGQLRLILPQPGAVYATPMGAAGFLNFSPDGKRLAAAEVGDGDIIEWDLATGKRLGEPAEPAHLMALSGDGKTLALGGASTGPYAHSRSYPTVRLLELPTGKERALFDLSPERVWGHYKVALSPDGKFLASNIAGYGGARLRVWDVAAKKDVGLDYSNLAQPVFSADGQVLAYAGSPGFGNEIVLFETGAWKQRAVCKAPTPPGLYGDEPAALSPDGRLVAASTPEAVKLFDGATGAEKASLATSAQGGIVVRFSPDGKQLVQAAYVSRDITLWDVEGKKQVARYEGPPNTRLMDALFSPDGRSVFCSHSNGQIIRWGPGEERKEWHLPGPVLKLALTPDCRYLFTGNANGTVYVLDLKSGEGK